MSIPHPIPYQGSKRGIARAILNYFPSDCRRLIEPFTGSAALSLAAARHHNATAFLLNDVNASLMELWRSILEEPMQIAEAYSTLWTAQQGREQEFYNAARQEFNRTRRADLLLFLLARCVKAAVRYNARGEFNQSPDHRRKGTHPHTMRDHLCRAACLLERKTEILQGDYRAAVRSATEQDVIYLDPPYQGVCGTRDPRYISDVDFQEFVAFLGELNQASLSFIVSYDGRNSTRAYGTPLPEALELKHLEIEAGRSSQATLLGRNAHTIESLYLSPALVRRLEGEDAGRGVPGFDSDTSIAAEYSLMAS